MYPQARRQPRSADTVFTNSSAANSWPSGGFGDPGIRHHGDERQIVAEIGAERVRRRRRLRAALDDGLRDGGHADGGCAVDGRGVDQVDGAGGVPR